MSADVRTWATFHPLAGEPRPVMLLLDRDAGPLVPVIFEDTGERADVRPERLEVQR